MWGQKRTTNDLKNRSCDHAHLSSEFLRKRLLRKCPLTTLVKQPGINGICRVQRKPLTGTCTKWIYERAGATKSKLVERGLAKLCSNVFVRTWVYRIADIFKFAFLFPLFCSRFVSISPLPRLQLSMTVFEFCHNDQLKMLRKCGGEEVKHDSTTNDYVGG